jgi:membrane protease YdiL (CAAX protease family)
MWWLSSEEQKMNLKTLLLRYPLTIYFALVYMIAWGGGLLVAGATRLSGNAISMAQLSLVMLMMLLAPSAASVLVTILVTGRGGLNDLWTRMRHWRVAPRWYAVAILTTPVVATGVLLALTALRSPAYAPNFNLLFGLAIGLLAGFFEEIGWSGFATPRLLQKYNPLIAGLLLGIPWGVWHMMAGFLGSTPGQEGFWLADMMLFWVISLTAYRILMTWVYSKTASVLVAQVMHAFFSGTLGVVLPALLPADKLIFDLVFAAGLWLLVGILALAYRRPQAQPATQTQAA